MNLRKEAARVYLSLRCPEHRRKDTGKEVPMNCPRNARQATKAPVHPNDFFQWRHRERVDRSRDDGIHVHPCSRGSVPSSVRVPLRCSNDALLPSLQTDPHRVAYFRRRLPNSYAFSCKTNTAFS